MRCNVRGPSTVGCENIAQKIEEVENKYTKAQGVVAGGMSTALLHIIHEEIADKKREERDNEN
jgi:hypothetical protein